MILVPITEDKTSYAFLVAVELSNTALHQYSQFDS